MKPSLPTRLPFVLDALVTLLKDPEGPLAGVQIVDGPVRDLADIKDDALGVAPGSQDQPGAAATRQRQPGAGRAAYEERVDVAMVLATYKGNDDMAARRARATEILAAVAGIIAENQVKPGAWDQAELGEQDDWFPTRNSSGVTVEVAFTLVFTSVI